MPKKFVGENSKAAAARTRKLAAKEAEIANKQKVAQEEYWKEEDKHVLRKQQRKEEQERKKQQQLEKKAEVKVLLEKETSAIKPASKQNVKVTRAQIMEERQNAAKTAKQTEIKTHIEQPLVENLNRSEPEEIAYSIDEAIAMLSSTTVGEDKHPEKRLKAAYRAYEDENLKRLKDENPTLRLSQLKQLLFKEWSKSNSNPLNKQN